MLRSVHIFVSGRVQGVFFRASARTQAECLGLQGFAKNLMDGRVEIVVSGEPRAIEKFLIWCREGPVNAEIDEVSVEDCQPVDGCEGFSIY